jgi:hypothetical protein
MALTNFIGMTRYPVVTVAGSTNTGESDSTRVFLGRSVVMISFLGVVGAVPIYGTSDHDSPPLKVLSIID